ncbi:MAG: ABC transporter ATP-binding protein [Chlamydiae bacterium]|nr:ABC transporter ATP-binding protein [Chlamydiota bacterium]MBI3276806.1 ABC transporter ATP-binding protein [Chlamydiota bacterium]
MEKDILIHIENLAKNFRNIPVLRGLNLDIYRGESLVIIGQSGEGKSVLLKHIIGLLKPDSGKILIEGCDIVLMPEQKLNDVRKRFGLLFQGAALFDSMTVGENVAFGLTEHTRIGRSEVGERVKELLSVVGLEGIEDLKPAELSGGMRKRVGLARAIAMDPEIILYDEPTTGIDPIMGDIINELIIKMNERLHSTSIAVTHDMASAFKIADRIAMLYDGKIIEVSPVEEFKISKNPIVQQFITGSAKGPITTEVAEVHNLEIKF